jgi:hypothetical protein
MDVRINGFPKTLREHLTCIKLERETSHETIHALLRQAESLVQEIYDWDEIILEYSILGKTEEVQRCLALAQEMVKNFNDLDLLAGIAWIGNDDILFKKCMDQLESLAQTKDQWEDCADTWETYPKSAVDAARCRVKANEIRGTE